LVAAKEVPTQRKLETSFISNDLESPGEFERNSGWRIAQHVWRNPTRRVVGDVPFEVVDSRVRRIRLR